MGLDALLGKAAPRPEPAQKHPAAPAPRDRIRLEELRPNPYQPRRDFEDEDIQTLAESMRRSGLLQPIVVRRVNGIFEVVAGERRCRAAKVAGMTEIPAVVRQVSDDDMLTLALVENIERKDLNSIEKAEAFRRLMELRAWTQEEAAAALGLARSTVANFLRLLDLPPEIQEAVSRGTLSMGHARALLGLNNRAQMIRLLQRIINEDLSVRALERIVATETRAAKKRAPRSRKEVHIQDLEQRLTQAMGTRVQLRTHGSAGEIVIHYYSTEQLNGLIEQLGA
ncbi:MAG: ParB/RepB/Spo0J family partition protein [Planctomycetota bacterium]